MTGTRDRDHPFRILLDEAMSRPDSPPLSQPPLTPEPSRPPAFLFDEGRIAASRRTPARFGDLASRYDRSGTAL